MNAWTANAGIICGLLAARSWRKFSNNLFLPTAPGPMLERDPGLFFFTHARRCFNHFNFPPLLFLQSEPVRVYLIFWAKNLEGNFGLSFI